MNTPKKTILTKNKFYNLLIILTIISIGLLTALAIYKINSIKSSTVSSILSNTLNNLETEIKIPIKNIRSQIKIAQEWGNSGLIDLQNPKKELISQFIPLLDQLDGIQSISLVDSSGQSYVIHKINLKDEIKDLSNSPQNTPSKKQNSNWHIFQYYPSKKGKVFTLDNTKKVIKEKSIEKYKDLRKMPWFQIATESNNSIFSYDVEDKDNIGTLAISWEDKNNKNSGVIAFEISIEYLNQDYNKPEQKGYTFLFDNSGKILNISNDNSTNLDIINKAIKYWQANPSNEFTTYSFKSDKSLWWTGFKTLNDTNNIVIAVITPENEILPDISKQKNRWYIIIGAIIIATLILAFILIKSYSHSLDRIDELKDSTNIDTESKLLTLIQNGESSKLEFKSTVRMNLKSGKTGKEIEQAWLKNVVAFLNTEGGSILLGVDDDGVIVGLERDNFKNKDNCLLHISNLIKQHIGLEFSSYIDIEGINIMEKEVVLLQITKTIEPAFLHMSKDDEEFYIRSGPSCLKLIISKAIKYINDQKSRIER